MHTEAETLNNQSKDSRDKQSKSASQFLPRREFLKTFAAGVFTGLVTLTSALRTTKAETLENPPQPTFPEVPEIPHTLEEFLGEINTYLQKEGFQIHPQLSTNLSGASELTLDEFINAVNTWGGFEVVIDAEKSNKQILIPKLLMWSSRKTGLGMNVSRLYHENSDQTTFPIFSKRSGDTITYVEYSSTSSGYFEAISTTDVISSKSTSSEEAPHNNDNNSQYIFDTGQIINSSQTTSERPRGIRYKNYQEAVRSLCPRGYFNGSSIPTMELLTAVGQGYRGDMVDIISTDGAFSYIDKPIYGPSSETLQFNHAGPIAHALLMHSAMHSMIGGEYTGHQMDIGWVQAYFDARKQQLAGSGDLKPAVIQIPREIKEINGKYQFDYWLNGNTPDSLKSFIVISTPNATKEIELLNPIPNGVICCSTARIDDQGNWYFPEKRSHIPDQAKANDRFFLFPDQFQALGLEIALSNQNNELTLVPEVYRAEVSGSSFSTMVGSVFVTRVIEELLNQGVAYSSDAIMQQLWELCPKITVDGVTARVPDIAKIAEYFGQEKSSHHLPTIKK